MMGVPIDSPYEHPGQDKPDGSPEGCELGSSSEEPTSAELDVKLPVGIIDDGLSFTSEDPRDQDFGKDTADRNRDGLSEKSSPQDSPDGGATERAQLVEFLKELDDADNRAFTADELAAISRKIQALRVEIRKETGLDRHQQEALEQWLAGVQRGSERIGSKDWIMYALGTATSLIIMETVPPLALLHLAAHAIHALGHLFIHEAEASP